MSSHVTHGFEVFSEAPQFLTNTTSVQGVMRYFIDTYSASTFSDTTKHYLDIFLFGLCGFSVTLAGLITNTINLIVYYKYGLREGMNSSFFALSFSDLAVAILNVIGLSGYFFDMMIPTGEIHPKALSYLTMVSPRAMFLGISAFTTGLISIERCFCVVRPFEVKAIFTQCRCILILVLIYLFNIAVYMPMHLTAGLEWQRDPAVNSTQSVRKLYFTKRMLEITSDVINGALVPATVHIVVIVSGIVLISGLKRSSKFRSSASSNSRSALNVSKVNKITSYGHTPNDSGAISQRVSNVYDTHRCMTSLVSKESDHLGELQTPPSTEFDPHVLDASQQNVNSSGDHAHDKTHESMTSSASKANNAIVLKVSDMKSKTEHNERTSSDLVNHPATTHDINCSVHSQSHRRVHTTIDISLGNLNTEENLETSRGDGAVNTCIVSAASRVNSGTLNHIPPRMSKKDTVLVRMVATLVVIHVICATPGIVYSFARIFIQDLDVGKRLEYLHNLLWVIVFILEGIRSSVNLLVYYKASSKYRAILVHMCCSC